jgi:hypothetical protein
MIIIRIIVLFLFLLWVEYYPKLNQFSPDTKFNFYRSLMCMFFALYSFDNSVNNLISGYIEPFTFKFDGFTDISKWFVAYLILDVGKMAWMKNTRWDLYVHHIWCLASYSIAFFYDKVGFFHSFVLVNEAISIVSGIDSMYIEEKQLDKSKQCKVYRKNIIKYLRLPVWIITLLMTLHHTHDMPDVMFWNGLITSCLMIWLDRYWEKKCDKVIDQKK